jgi:hypothetical protein
MIARVDERGFALPTAIFFVALLTLLLTAALLKVQGDRRVADSTGAAVTAVTVAQSGLQTYIGTQTTRPPDGDSTRINVVGGYTDVVALYAQRKDTMNPLYIIRSTGHVIDPTQGADPRASRTVAQFVQWQSAGTLNTYPAVFTARNGLTNWNGNGTFNLTQADSATCGGSVAAGITVPNNKPDPSKAPPATILYEEAPGQLGQLNVLGVDWATLIGPYFKPTYAGMTNPNTWSSYRIAGNYTLTTSGSGLLIVTGDLTISGTVTWAGVILVGKRIIFTGGTGSVATISGLLVTGLDGTAGLGTVGGTGLTQNIRYNTCNLRRALQFLTGFNAVTNAWIDNWGTY